jgi:sialic acid synthase SpsE
MSDYLFSDEQTYIIAEIGINHNGEYEVAKEMVQAAADAGADGVKFQLWEAHELSVDRETIELLQQWKLNTGELERLAALAGELGVDFFASVFDSKSIKQLIKLDAPIIKIASCDVTNLPLLRDAAQKDQPIIMSTGMATMSEVATAVETVQNEHNELCLLHCISSYPVDIEDLNLRAIDTLRSAFNLPVGFSDHTKGIVAPLLAVTRGATILEKHFTLDKTMEGPDQTLSAEPAEFSKMVTKIRSVEEGLGGGDIECAPSEVDSAYSMRRGIKAKTDINKGEKLTQEKLKISRPETGISPDNYQEVLNLEVSRHINKNDPINWKDI